MKSVFRSWVLFSLFGLSTVVVGMSGGNCTPTAGPTLALSTSGQGTVTADPAAASYTVGATVRLTATPDTGWSFDHWTGDLSGSTSPATLTLDTSKSVTAVFVAIPAGNRTLGVSITGQGTVQTDPAAASYVAGTQVQVTATASAGWAFDHWEGDLSGSTNPVTITLDNNKQITAIFAEVQSGDCDAAAVWTPTDISTNTTIPAGCYLVNATITVHNGAVLTLSPGVTLEFAQGVGLLVRTDGSLQAAGTAASPIVLTGQNHTRGYWDGLEFDDSNSSSNILDYVTIEYGGGSDESSSADLTIWGSTRVAISHCTLRQSPTYGAWLSTSCNVTAFANNTVTQNTLAAVALPVNQLGVLTTTSTFTGNDADLIWMWGSHTDVDQTWSALGVPYVVHENVVVDHHTTIAPGVQLIFMTGVSMTVNSSGVLTAQGTASSPILFTATDHTPGYWDGLEFDDSNSSSNILDYVTIEYGGGSDESSSADLTIWGSTRVAISHCTLRQSPTYGAWLSTSCNVTAFANNTVTQNTLAAVALPVNQLGVLTTTSTFTGNDADLIWMWGSHTDVDQTWSALGVPYVVHENVVVDHHTTIAPGVQLIFMTGVSMTVNSSGVLTAQGTASSPILFTATDHTPGYWDGLEFDDSNSSSNILDYVTIEYGGGSDESSSADLTIWGSTRVQVQHSTFQHGKAWGIWISTNATVNSDIATANTFADNVLGDVSH